MRSKVKVSISMDEQLLQQVKDHVDGALFRNSSHVIEYATRKFLGDKK